MKKLVINTGKPYEVRIERGSLENCGALISERMQGKSACIVTDSNVAPLYLKTVVHSLERSGFRVCSHTFRAGEDSKNLENIAKMYTTFAENQITRSDFVVALGGGVVGDMAGFAAATYLRGIQFVQIPTTFLAAIDSSVGGKTGVNIAQGKNLVGAFHQPSLVICDPDTFKTLSSYEMADGIAEAIKYGVIRDEELFRLLERGEIENSLDEIVLRSIAIKKDVVEKDEFDLGERMLLNYGHTFGHAIEKLSQHKISHGHAVAMGMVLINEIGVRLGVLDLAVAKRIERCIQTNGITTCCPFSAKELAPYCLNDKKRMGGTINLIFAKAIGESEISQMPVERFSETAQSIDNKIGRVARVGGTLCGEIDAPASKSDMHRVIICASLAEGTTIVEHATMSDDIHATIQIMRAMGATIELSENSIYITGTSTPNKEIFADCNESGSTLRFLLPLFSALGCTAHFSGKGKLPERPLEPLKSQMERLGAVFSQVKLPLTISGKLQAGEYQLSGDVSSQFISGLLFALPLLPQDSTVVLTSQLQSKPYVDMTLRTLARFGITVSEQENKYFIKGNQTYSSPGKIKADGDWSNGAFWIVAGAIGGDIKIHNLDIQSLQGDRAVCAVLLQMGAEITMCEDTIHVKKSALKGTLVDAKNIPDIVPILAVAAAAAKGQTRFIGAQRLRMKESNRILSTVAMLNKLGVKAEETEDGLIVEGNQTLGSGIVDSFNDHRIAMSASIASTLQKGFVEIINPDCVNKSYPDFYHDFRQLGGNVDVINVGE